MIIAKATENHKGIYILGDYLDLENLHNAIHSISKEGIIGEDIILSFAYDIRKAYYGNRSFEKISYGDATLKYMKVEIAWPIAIVTANLIREYAGFINTSKEVQANIYRLESALENVLESNAMHNASAIIKWINVYKIPLVDYLDQIVFYLTYKILKTDSNKNIYSMLKNELELLNPISPKHQDFKATIEAEAKNLNCSTKDINIDFDKLGLRW